MSCGPAYYPVGKCKCDDCKTARKYKIILYDWHNPGGLLWKHLDHECIANDNHSIAMFKRRTKQH